MKSCGQSIILNCPLWQAGMVVLVASPSLLMLPAFHPALAPSDGGRTIEGLGTHHHQQHHFAVASFFFAANVVLVACMLQYFSFTTSVHNVCERKIIFLK